MCNVIKSLMEHQGQGNPSKGVMKKAFNYKELAKTPLLIN